MKRIILTTILICGLIYTAAGKSTSVAPFEAASRADDPTIIITDLDIIQDYLELEEHPYVPEFDAYQDGVIDSWDVIAINMFVTNRLMHLPIRRGPCPDPGSSPIIPRLHIHTEVSDIMPTITCFVPVDNSGD